MNEELVQRESLGIDLDLPFKKDHKETKSGEPQAAPTISPLTTEQTVIQVWFLELNKITPRQHLPFWWEDKEVQ